MESAAGTGIGVVSASAHASPAAALHAGAAVADATDAIAPISALNAADTRERDRMESAGAHA